MANISDYLDWRGDLDFSVSPFCEVDNLILSELAYVDFDGIVPGEDKRETITIQKACRDFFSLYSEEENQHHQDGSLSHEKADIRKKIRQPDAGELRQRD